VTGLLTQCHDDSLPEGAVFSVRTWWAPGKPPAIRFPVTVGPLSLP